MPVMANRWSSVVKPGDIYKIRTAFLMVIKNKAKEVNYIGYYN